MTALKEYQQTSVHLPPSMMCSYTIKVPLLLVDLRELDDSRWDPIWQLWNIDGRQCRADGIDPPTWDMGDLVIGANHPGLIFPSTANPGGVNLVLFPQVFPSGEEVIVVNDPDGKLPRNDASWR